MKTKFLLVIFFLMFGFVVGAQDVVTLNVNDDIATTLNSYTGTTGNVVLVIPQGYTNPQSTNTIDLSAIPTNITKLTLKGDGTAPVLLIKLINPPSTLSLLEFQGLTIQGAASDPTTNYIINEPSTAVTTIDSLVFANDTISGFRSALRFQSTNSTPNQIVKHLIVSNCVARSFPDYGFVYNNKSGGMVGSIIVDQSTFYGFGQSFLLLQPGITSSVSISNCTFDNLPETSGKYLIDLNTEVCPVTISNVLLGKDISGAKGIRTGGTLTVSNSYKTSDWTDALTTNSTESFTAYSSASSTLFKLPTVVSGSVGSSSFLASYGNYTIIDPSFVGRSSVGDPRWYYQSSTPISNQQVKPLIIRVIPGAIEISKPANVEVFNVTGKVVLTASQQSVVSTASLPQGVYIIKAQTNESNITIQKVMVQ